MKQEIRNVIFDFGGVIVNLNRTAVERRFAEMGVDVKSFLGMSRQEGVFGDLELGRISADEWCRRVMEMAPAFPVEGRRQTLTKAGIIEAWNLMVEEVPLRRLQALDTLRKRYHISLLSNTNELHTRYSFDHLMRSQGYEPYDLFEHIFLSDEMHLAKPGRDIFEETLRQSGYQPEETLFIDDSEENCRAFAALGVQTFCPKWPDEWLGELCPSVASIGQFDGVHLGHRFLINQVKKEAERRQIDSLLVTFYEHPRTVLQSDYIPELLTSPDEKLTLLRETGVDRIEMLHFTKSLSQLSAKQYMQQVLHDQLGVRVLVMGYDHRFGHDGGTLEQYEQWGREVGMEVIKTPSFCPKGGANSYNIVSSSVVRRMLKEGKVDEAAVMLGHPYVLQGQVVKGHHVGHELGFPTANLQPFTHKLIPARGVYAVWAEVEGQPTEAGKTRRYRGMLNIGDRPTIDNSPEVTIEVNLLDFEGDLYGRDITVRFMHFLRQEQRFASREALVDQIRRDEEQVKALL